MTNTEARDRLRKLVKLESRIRDALLGEDREARYDLVALQRKVNQEISELSSKAGRVV